ncbi:MAG: hypothetical protein IJB95_03060 [Clostridia bacterium]|nr:hypothetical protein [Clostridia bacterium]
MNKKVLLLILIFVLFASVFAFASCQNQLQIDIQNSIVGIPDITEKIVPGKESSDNKHYWVLKYYVDPAQFDLSTANSIKIKTWMPTYKGSNLKTYQTTFTGIIPEDVAPTADKNYFTIELEKKKYNPTAERPYDYTTGQYGDNFYLDANGVKHFYFYQNFETVLNCYVYVNDNSGDATDDNPMDNVTKLPSIGLTFVLGIVMVIVGFVLYLIALIVFQNKLSIAIAFSIPLIFTIGSWFVWGWARGLIMTVFFVIYYVCIETFAKRVAETLGY